MGLLDVLAMAQRTLTIVSSGFNALYFATYRHPVRRHRFGTMLLAFMNLAVLVESLYRVLPRLLWSGGELWLLADPRLNLAMGSLPFAVSLLLTAIILRHMRNRRRL